MQCKAALLWTSWVLGRVKLPMLPDQSPSPSCPPGKLQKWKFSFKMTTVSFSAAGNAFLLRSAAELLSAQLIRVVGSTAACCVLSSRSLSKARP